MKSESELISVIEKYPGAASFKEADTGKYVLANDRLALDIGIQDPKNLIGLTVHDLRFAQSKEGIQQAKRIAELDFFACEKKELVQSQFVFCKSDSGDVLCDEMIKLPVLGHSGNILGVVTYQRNLTFALPLNRVYDMYRRFYAAPEAIKRVMAYLGITQCFTTPPTEVPFRILLAKTQSYTNKEIGRLLGISHRTVDYQFSALRNRVVDGDVHRVLLTIKRRDA